MVCRHRVVERYSPVAEALRDTSAKSATKTPTTPLESRRLGGHISTRKSTMSDTTDLRIYIPMTPS